MERINKGTIASISGNTARVVPYDASTGPTIMITIPWHLRGEAGSLKKGTEVVYVEFDDFTGVLIGRMDGEGGGGSSGKVQIMTKDVAGIAKVGDNLMIDDEGRLSVDTADAAVEADQRPITAQGVYSEFSVINALLKTI